MNVVTHTPLVSIDLLAQNANGDYLVGKRVNEPAKGSWFVPGGRIYKNEGLDAAFGRITETELGRRCGRNEASFVGVYEHFYDNNFAEVDGIGTHYVVLAYRLNDVLPDAFPSCDQHAVFAWMSPQQLLEHPQADANTKAYFRP